MPNVVKICAKINTTQNINFFTFCSFTVLNKLKALQLSMVGLSTIKHQQSKKLTWWIKATWTKKTWKCKLFARVCSQKVFKMFTICTDTCLETLSSLVSCSVNNGLSEIGPYCNQAFLQYVLDSERTKSKMFVFCMVLIFTFIFMKFCRHLLDNLDDKKSHLKCVLHAW